MVNNRLFINNRTSVPQSGFTLVELAIVVVITSILLTMGITALTVQSENAAFTATRNRQQIISEALSGYLGKNGRLPCPDVLGAGGNVVGRGDDNRATPADVTTQCTSDIGVVPYIDLGLPRDSVLDGWENYFTYRVTTDATLALDWTRSSPTFVPGKPGKLVVSERNPATNPVLVSLTAQTNAVYVIVSHGRNGLGATTTQGTPTKPPTAGTDEALNIAGATADGFIRRDVTAVDIPTYGSYDDIVFFGMADKLVAPLVKDGSLRSAEGTTQKALSDMVDVIIGQSVSTATLPVAAPVIFNDGWGTPVVYTRSYAAQVSMSSPAPGTVGFTVTSFGPDRAPSATDNIVISITTDTLRPIYAKSGTLPP